MIKFHQSKCGEQSNDNNDSNNDSVFDVGKDIKIIFDNNKKALINNYKLESETYRNHIRNNSYMILVVWIEI
jgi:hypothetical protein